jgi:UDP-GlcNAc:undecaprenyl-phosphate GlcNAc-1-phosphate transferase
VDAFVLLELLPIVIAFLATVFLIMALNPVAWRFGWLDKPDDARKLHSDAVPLTGGVAMLIAFGVAMLVDNHFQYRLLGGMAGLCIVGLMDDLVHLSPRSRLVIQAVFATVVCYFKGLHLCYLGDLFGFGAVILPHWLGLALMVFCILAMVNAINMIDGVDGLAGGVLVMALLWLAFLASQTGSDPVTPLILGACLGGYLCFNMRGPFRQKAAVFMGDAGSTMMGFAVTWLMIIYSRNEVIEINEFPPILVAWLLAVPILDTVSLILTRLRNGKSPFEASRDHIHHILQRSGLSDRQVSIVVIMASFVIGGVGVAAWMVGMPELMLSYGFVLMFVVYYYAIHHKSLVLKLFRFFVDR